MVKKILTLATVLVLAQVAFADRVLERAEVLQLFERLTARPAKTWISCGEIAARHREYRAAQTADEELINARIAEKIGAYRAMPDKLELAEELRQMRLEAIPFNVRYAMANEHTMQSDVIVRFDGERFYWQIDVESRTDSVVPPAALKDNFCTRHFNQDWNRRRVFAWDGRAYTTYFRPGNHATITDSPSGVNGPLTAGIIQWGYGRYSYENLAAAESSAVETERDAKQQIHLSVLREGETETFAIEPANNYVVSLYTREKDGIMEVRTYADYKNAGGALCPGSIVIERYDTTESPRRLRAGDYWQLTSINTDAPADASFNVAYDYDALIEDFRFEEPLLYRYSTPDVPLAGGIDTEKLKLQRVMFAQAQGSCPLNCATAALGYIAQRLGRSISFEDAAAVLESGISGTSLAALQAAAEKLGLYTVAVRTDLKSLKDLPTNRTIAYLPDSAHYVVVGAVDGEYVRLIDLASNAFYQRMPSEVFDSLWDGVAVIIDDKPVELTSRLAKLDGGSLEQMVGGCAVSCTRKIQDGGNYPCASSPPCGSHTITYTRYGCQTAVSGSCSTSSMIFSKTEDCQDDGYGGCYGVGNWVSYYGSACK